MFVVAGLYLTRVYLFIYTVPFFTDSSTSLGCLYTAAHTSRGKVSKETGFFCGPWFCLIGPLGTESTKSPETALMGVGGFWGLQRWEPV